MKIRRLPEIDLARIAPKPTDEKRIALESFKVGQSKITITYRHVRPLFADIFNVKPDLFSETVPTTWPVLERLIRRSAKPGDEADANLLVAKGLYQFASANALRSRSHTFYPLSLSIGEKVEYWLPMVTALDDAPLVIFIDPRRGTKLTAKARRFVFSMMNEHIRVANPDFAEARLGILQFGDMVEDQRPVKFWTDTGIALYGFDELDQMVRETYDIWREVSEARESETRRKSAGGYGPLFD
jgi:hypothetical protein